MKLKNLTCLAVTLLMLSATHAQVKKQFKDSTNGLTTIVVKEEGASDADILNDQFDIDEMGMHQVIRITTEGDIVKDEPTPEVPTIVEEPEEEFTEKGVITAQLEPVIQEETLETKIITTKKVEQKQEAIVTVANQGRGKQTQSYTGNSNRRTAFKPFYSKKRFKKKKRKKVRKARLKKGRCYRF